MSTIVVSTISTADNNTPLFITTGNTSIGIDMFPGNGAVRFRGTNLLQNGLGLGAGKQTLWEPASALIPKVTGGPAAGLSLTPTNLIQSRTLDFDPGSIEGAQFQIKMPKHWDKGNVSFSPVWSQATTSAGAVSWNLAAVAISNSENIDATLGTPITLTSSGGTANTIYIGSESNPVTINGSPQTDDLIIFEISRYATGATDTLAVDARLHGVNIYYTANTNSDA